MKKLIPLSPKELSAAHVIRDLLKRRLTAPVAAQKLEVSVRHTFRLKQKMKKFGARALAHGSRGTKGKRGIPKTERRKIEALIKERFFDFTPTLAAEKLNEDHGINRDRKTIGKIMDEMGLLVKKNRRSVPAIHREWREPKESLGMLVQFDGSYEAWLEDRFTNPDGSHELCLLVAIDDATSALLHVEIAAHEGVLPVMNFWRSYMAQHGLPEAIYLDKFSTYKMHMVLAAENADTKTQFARAMRELEVTLHFANSPQAKGRVERVNRTLQDRCVKELRLAGISTIEEANAFIQNVFIPKFNRQFARAAKVSGDRHRALSAKVQKDLSGILSRHDMRTLRNDFTIAHGSIFYQLHETPGLALRPKDLIEVRTAPDGLITLFAREKAVCFSIITAHVTHGKKVFATKYGVIRVPTLAPREIKNDQP